MRTKNINRKKGSIVYLKKGIIPLCLLELLPSYVEGCSNNGNISTIVTSASDTALDPKYQERTTKELHQAVEADNLGQVQSILEDIKHRLKEAERAALVNAPYPNNKEDHKQYTVIEKAIKGKKIQIATELIQYENIDIQQKNPTTGMTPLHMAAHYIDITIFPLLLQELGKRLGNASIKELLFTPYQDSKTSTSYTVFTAACFPKHKKHISQMFKKHDFSMFDYVLSITSPYLDARNYEQIQEELKSFKDSNKQNTFTEKDYDKLTQIVRHHTNCCKRYKPIQTTHTEPSTDTPVQLSNTTCDPDTMAILADMNKKLMEIHGKLMAAHNNAPTIPEGTIPPPPPMTMSAGAIIPPPPPLLNLGTGMPNSKSTGAAQTANTGKPQGPSAKELQDKIAEMEEKRKTREQKAAEQKAAEQQQN